MVLQVVWFKRDLRVSDHTALSAATQIGEVLPLYVVEEQYWQQPDTSLRQWLFTRECLIDLDAHLQGLTGVKYPALYVAQVDVIAALEIIHRAYGTFVLHSHQETGNRWTYQRDKRVAAWCQAKQIRWAEYPQFGVLRPNPDRDRWAASWERFMAKPQCKSPGFLRLAPRRSLQSVDELPQHLGYWQDPCAGRQVGGRHVALDMLDSFLSDRGRFYRSSISSPLSAQNGCSRLSPYLAMGCLSLREVVQRIRTVRKQSPDLQWLKSLDAFESRLWWHCHFIQKLEDQVDIEWRNLHPAYDNLRQNVDAGYLQAWQSGHTGWPLVDASIRYLRHQGWLNFRMRAMIVSCASYLLRLPWQSFAPWLAGQFTDYEPGIHYPQIQMQAGTTGINIPRIYSPIKQAQQLDPQGIFVRRWVPELRQLSTQWLHQPWLMTLPLQRTSGVIIGQDYPAPLVDFTLASRQVRAELKALRTGDFRKQAALIGDKHGSRRRPQSSRRSKQSKVNRDQLSLF